MHNEKYRFIIVIIVFISFISPLYAAIIESKLAKEKHIKNKVNLYLAENNITPTKANTLKITTPANTNLYSTNEIAKDIIINYENNDLVINTIYSLIEYKNTATKLNKNINIFIYELIGYPEESLKFIASEKNNLLISEKINTKKNYKNTRTPSLLTYTQQSIKNSYSNRPYRSKLSTNTVNSTTINKGFNTQDDSNFLSDLLKIKNLIYIFILLIIFYIIKFILHAILFRK